MRFESYAPPSRSDGAFSLWTTAEATWLSRDRLPRPRPSCQQAPSTVVCWLSWFSLASSTKATPRLGSWRTRSFTALGCLAVFSLYLRCKVVDQKQPSFTRVSSATETLAGGGHLKRFSAIAKHLGSLHHQPPRGFAVYKVTVHDHHDTAAGKEHIGPWPTTEIWRSAICLEEPTRKPGFPWLCSRMRPMSPLPLRARQRSHRVQPRYKAGASRSSATKATLESAQASVATGLPSVNSTMHQECLGHAVISPRHASRLCV
nr:uncharacterized protein LOC126540566 [Dermacentor andersoni]